MSKPRPVAAPGFQDHPRREERAAFVARVRALRKTDIIVLFGKGDDEVL